MCGSRVSILDQIEGSFGWVGRRQTGAPVDLGLRTRQAGLRSEQVHPHAGFGGNLRADVGHDGTALRFTDQHALLSVEKVTDPLRVVALLAWRVTVGHETSRR